MSMLYSLYTRAIKPALAHAALVWRLKTLRTNPKIKLAKVQGEVLLAIEILLDLLMQEEESRSLHKLRNTSNPRSQRL